MPGEVPGEAPGQPRDIGVAGVYLQEAYHGSPYRFESFEAGKRGSGQGAATFGRGDVYAAELRGVAEDYRLTLSPAELSIEGRALWDVIGLTSEADYHGRAFIETRWPDAQARFGGDAAKTAAYLAAQARRRAAESRRDGHQRWADLYERAAVALDRLVQRPARVDVRQSQLYRVEVPESDRLLDWDRPFSQQPEAVRQALSEFDPGEVKTEWRVVARTAAGPETHNFYVAGKLAGYVVHFDPGGPKEAFSASVFERGEARPGGRAPIGPFRTLEEAKAIVEARAPMEPVGEDLYGRLVKQLGSPDAASAKLHRRGLLGIRYLDAGSRAAGEGTYNFVVFDAADVKIVETYYQSAALREKTETLEAYGITPGLPAGTMRVAQALESRTIEKYGRIGREDRSPEAAAKVAARLVDELGFELDPRRIRTSGKGWYRRFQKGLDIAGRKHPELIDNAAARSTGRFRSRKDARDLFTLFTAISSQNIEAGENFGIAGRMFEAYVATGKIPTDIGRGAAQEAVAKNVAKVQRLIDSIGLRKTIALLLTEDTVSANNRRARAQELAVVGGMGKTERVPLAAVVLGPKIGAFFANLSGKTGYLTMDLWWTRQINRLRGDMRNRIPGLADAPTNEKGEKVGVARFKQAIGRPEISDEDALAMLPEYAARAEEKYRIGIPKTEAEAAAQYLQTLMTTLREQPDNVADGSFMLDVAKRTQQLLRERGHDLSIADIQAIAWYYEKRLYAEQGARETPARSYEEAATDYVEGRTGRSTELPPTGAGELPGRGSREWVGRSAGFPGQGRGRVGRLDPREPPGSYGRGDRDLHAGDLARSLGAAAEDVLDVHVPTELAPKKFKQGRFAGPAYAEIAPTPSGVLRFVAAIGKVKQDPNGAAVEIKAPEDYARMRMFLAPDGTAGFALDGDNIVSGPHKSVTMAMLQLAVREGGRRLDAFDTILPEAYSAMGFRAVARIPWDDAQAPAGWDKQHFAKFNGGEPDVVFMVSDPTYGRVYRPGDGQAFPGWDAAEAHQRAEVDRLRASEATGTFYQGPPGEPAPPRAAIELGEGLARLWVGPKADGTSLIHEHGHAFVEWLPWAALREQATDAAKRDWGVIRDWLGATDDVPLTRAQHEQFATAFERYLAEGKAPSPELIPIFERFKRWMIEVYRTVQAIAPEIPPQIRDVMDRMLASDEQIARARMQNQGPPPPRTFDEALPIKTGQDDIEGLIEDLATSDDYEVRLAQIEAEGRLSAEDKAALGEADVIAAKAELYAKAYEAAAASMA